MRTRAEARAAFPILVFFEYAHLPSTLQAISGPICTLAYDMATNLPIGPETSAGLRKFLEAKDCFVRAQLSTSTPKETT